MLTRHELGMAGVDRSQDTGASGKLGNALSVVVEQLGWLIHTARTKPT